MATDQADECYMRFEPRFCGTVAYYTAMAAARKVWIDVSLRYDKRNKALHRTRIADTRGPLDLTVPVVKPHAAGLDRPLRWADVAISAHGDWWNVHRVTLESAYGRTPYFEFYIDRFLPFLHHPSDMPFGINSVIDLDMALDTIIREILLIDALVVTVLPDGASSMEAATAIAEVPLLPYYQVREDRFGFLSGLSILDLIFNLGPESPLIIHRKSLHT